MIGFKVADAQQLAEVPKWKPCVWSPDQERLPLGGEWSAQTCRRLAFASRLAGSWSVGHPGSDHRLAAQLETSDRTIGETRREWGLQECSVLKSEPAPWFAEAQAFSRGGSCCGGSRKGETG